MPMVLTARNLILKIFVAGVLPVKFDQNVQTPKYPWQMPSVADAII